MKKAALLIKKAENAESPEIEIDRLLNEMFGRPHEAPSFSKDNLLINEVSISEESLRKILNWLKLHTIRSPSVASVVSGIDDIYPVLFKTEVTT